jgi:Rrf2 family protein
MYLSRTAEYSLRAMTYLARLQTSKRIRVRDLAEAVDLPAPYLSKIMQKLTAVGILDGQKGHHGGFLLAKPPAEIRFIDILQAVDFNPVAEHCLFGWDSCDEQDPCPLHPQWSILKDQIEQWARSHTLADSLMERQDS